MTVSALLRYLPVPGLALRRSSILRVSIPLSLAVILLVSGSRSAWALGDGIVDESYEYPNACAVLGLKFPGDENPRIASGVLIHPQVVLTAGHVIDWFQTIWEPEEERHVLILEVFRQLAAQVDECLLQHVGIVHPALETSTQPQLHHRLEARAVHPEQFIHSRCISRGCTVQQFRLVS